MQRNMYQQTKSGLKQIFLTLLSVIFTFSLRKAQMLWNPLLTNSNLQPAIRCHNTEKIDWWRQRGFRRNALLKQFENISSFAVHQQICLALTYSCGVHEQQIALHINWKLDLFYCFENIQFQYSINKIAFRDRKDATLLLSECFCQKVTKLPTTLTLKRPLQ